MKLISPIRMVTNEKLKNIKGDVVLDIGVGPANHSFIAEKTYIGIDKKATPSVSLIADAKFLPIKGNVIDIILCIGVLQHDTNPKGIVDEAYRVLKRGGSFYLVVPFIYPLHDIPHDYFRFTEFGVTEMLKNFNSIQISSVEGLFSLINFFFFLVCTAIRKGGRRRILYPLPYTFYVITRLFLPLDRFFRMGQFAIGYFVIASKY
jgi:ubiquinone/menaquinone biosynthesis C-methylase UbiE